MQELLRKNYYARRKKEALTLINCKENLRKTTIKRKTNFIRKAHAFAARNLVTLLRIA
jgi:hypothetical protein